MALAGNPSVHDDRRRCNSNWCWSFATTAQAVSHPVAVAPMCCCAILLNRRSCASRTAIPGSRHLNRRRRCCFVCQPNHTVQASGSGERATIRPSACLALGNAVWSSVCLVFCRISSVCSFCGHRLPFHRWRDLRQNEKIYNWNICCKAVDIILRNVND